MLGRLIRHATDFDRLAKEKAEKLAREQADREAQEAAAKLAREEAEAAAQEVAPEEKIAEGIDELVGEPPPAAMEEPPVAAMEEPPVAAMEEPPVPAAAVDETIPPEAPPAPPGGEQPPVPPQPPAEPPLPPPAGGAGGPSIEIPETIGGSTRALPNAQYFDNPDTQELLKLMETNQKRRGKVTWDETKKAATEDLEKIEEYINVGAKPSAGWKPYEVTALRKSLEKQAQVVAKKSKEFHAQIQGGEPLTHAQAAEMQQLLNRLAATENLIAGAANEAAVLLNALKIPVDSQYGSSRAISKLAAEGGGIENMTQRVKTIVEAGDDTQKILNGARETFAQKAWKTLMTWRYNMMLSSVRTHMANIFGSLTAGGFETAVVKPLATLNNYAASKILGDERVMTTMDNLEAFKVAMISHKQAAITARDIALGKTTPDDAGKFLNELGMRIQPIRKPIADKPGEFESLSAGQAARIAGNTPSRLLEAEDAFFRSVFYQQELSLQSRRAARRAYPDDLKKQAAMYEKYMNGAAPADLQEAARQYAAKLTFTNDPSIYGKLLGGLAKTAGDLQRVPGMQLLLPFVRTPANIMNYVMHNSVVGQVFAPSKTWKELSGSDPAARAEALARIEIGLGVMALTHEMVDDGTLTGIGSTDYGMIKLLESQGFKRNSIKFGDTYYSLERFDPIGLLLGIAASGWEIANDVGQNKDSAYQIFTGTILGMADLILDRSYLSTFGDFFEALASGASGGKQLSRVMTGTVSSFFTPGIVRDFRELTDASRREMAFPMTASGMVGRVFDQVTNAYPIASRSLPNAIDWKGDPIISSQNMVARAFFPIRTSEYQPDEVSQMLIANGISPKKPKENIYVPGSGRRSYVNLLEYDPTGRLYAEWQAYIGKARYKGASEIVGDSGFKEAMDTGLYGEPESVAGQALRKGMRAYENEAKIKFMEYMKEGKVPSKIIPGGFVDAPHGFLEDIDIENIIESLKYKKAMQVEGMPGLHIAPSGRYTPKGFGVEF